jgi:hypothetical protein
MTAVSPESASGQAAQGSVTELAPPPFAVARASSGPPRARGDTAPPTAQGSSGKRLPSSLSGFFSPNVQSGSAAARGTLGRTPLAHLFVYVLDRRLTGTLVLTLPEEMGIQHGIYFASGIPLRIWMPPGIAPLTRMLVRLGSLRESMLDDALFAIVGDHEAALDAELLRQGWVSEGQMAQARALQLREGIEFLFRLPDTAEYAFFADTDLVEGHAGAIAGRVAPLELLVGGLRVRGEDAAMRRVFERLGSAPLVLSPGVRAESYGFDLEESSAFEAIALSAASFADLTQNPLIEPAAARRVVYVLLLTRALALANGSSQRPPIESPASSR